MSEMSNMYTTKPNSNCRKDNKRIGRGSGSGTGGTSGKGHKGQRARSGKPRPYVGFEGGQRPLYRRLPKRGFTNIFKKVWGIINVETLNRFEDGTNIDLNFLKEIGLIKNNIDIYKILGNGEITKKLNIKTYGITKSAKEKLEKGGCTIEIISLEKEEEKN